MTADPSANADIQRERNRQRFDAWDASEPHRRKLTGEVARGFDPAAAPRLLVLGAGPLVDLDLPGLLKTFAGITLVDLDAETLPGAVARQLPGGDVRVATRGGIDLLPADPDAPSEPTAVPDLGGPFDCVVSPALLTQLIETALGRLGRERPGAGAFAEAVTIGHLRTMMGLLKPGGVGLLVTDLFSGVTAPGLADWTADEVPARVEAELARGNIYHGVHPRHLIRTLRHRAAFVGGPASVQLLKPWVWHTDHRAFAMTGVKFKMKAEAPA